MAQEPEDDDLNLDQEIEPDEGQDLAPDDDGSDGEEAPEIGFADEEEPEDDGPVETPLMRDLRAANRRQAKEIAQLRSGQQQAAPEPIVVGDKPTEESCDWDAGRLASELDAWHERKAAAERQTQERAAADQVELAKLNEQRAALKIPETVFHAAAATVKAEFTELQQMILASAADNPAKLIVALSKSPQKLEMLASITNPAKFSAAIGKLEDKITMNARKTPPAPEGTVRGSAPLSVGANKERERLEKEADRTGDRTKVIAYNRAQREKAARKS